MVDTAGTALHHVSHPLVSIPGTNGSMHEMLFGSLNTCALPLFHGVAPTVSVRELKVEC